MKKLGGYKLIDFGGVDISTSKTISGIYEKIEKTEKRIVGCNLKLGTTTFKELTLDVKKDGTNLVLSNSIIKVTITNANAVVGEVGLYGGYSDDNSSTKKIYCHPIVCINNTIRTSFLIFDNNSEVYTWDTLKAKLTSIAVGIDDTARIVATGSWYASSTLNVVGSIDVTKLGVISVYGMTETGTTNTLVITDAVFEYFFDGVNAIN